MIKSRALVVTILIALFIVMGLPACLNRSSTSLPETPAPTTVVTPLPAYTPPTVTITAVTRLPTSGLTPASTSIRKIVVIHTNDEHGWLLPFSPADAFVTWGGVANLMALLTEHGYDPRDPEGNILFLSGGDNWVGPAISTWFQGEPAVEVMNAMGYDATAIGNHEFDFGLEVLEKRVAEAQFPFLASNIFRADTGAPPAFATPYVIFTVNGVQVGVIGLANVDTPQLTHPQNVEGLVFADYEETLRRVVPEVRAKGAEIIVVETHICYDDLVDLAGRVGDLGIQLMEGGHCHVDGSVSTVNGILLAEAGAFWRNCTVTTLIWDTATDTLIDSAQEILANGYLTSKGNPRTPDPEIEAIVSAWQQKADAALGRVIGYVSETIPRDSPMMHNLVVDAWLWADPNADLAFTNEGGFRQALPAGEITIGDIVGVLPFENTLVELTLTGEQVVKILEMSRPMAVGGLRYTHHTSASGTVVDEVTLIPEGKPLDPKARYRVIITDYMYANPERYPFRLMTREIYDTAISWRQPVIDWIVAQRSSKDRPLNDLIDAIPRK